jgi:hypothetical protein
MLSEEVDNIQLAVDPRGFSQGCVPQPVKTHFGRRYYHVDRRQYKGFALFLVSVAGYNYSAGQVPVLPYKDLPDILSLQHL